MVRPRIVCIFDQVSQEIIIGSPLTAGGDYAEACARIERVAADLALPVSANTARNIEVPALSPTLGTDAKTFGARVAKAKDYILAGFLNFDDHAVVGSSPEILVRLRGDVVTVRPIAGTRPRGKTTAEDNQFEADLLADPKECAEHLMLLDLGRNDVGRVAKPGSVKVTERFTIERYSHVMHIVSNVEGEIQDGLDTLDALFAGFPAGTVSGAPKVRAMEIIDELEDEKRGIYAGAVGYLSVTGDMDTAIALRTAIVKDGILHVRAGAGIVMDSVAQMEFEETIHKSNALFRAAEQSVRFGGNA
jgi:anthranilate synthase component 1